MSEQKMQVVANMANAGLITFSHGIWTFTEKGHNRLGDFIKPEMSTLDFIDWLLLNSTWVRMPEVFNLQTGRMF
jgi:hypothetical protein